MKKKIISIEYNKEKEKDKDGSFIIKWGRTEQAIVNLLNLKIWIQIL